MRRDIRMNIFVYSDESGVFDVVHNQHYIFGGVLFLDKESRDGAVRKYLNAERTIRKARGIAPDVELKASFLRNSDKGKLFRATGKWIRFGTVINEQSILSNIWQSKKDKQRYLDYAYKIGVKRCFQQLIKDGQITPEEVENIYFFVDEHTTATNGRYELRESMEREFKYGIYNYTYTVYHSPLFPNLRSLTVSFCNSKSITLVRAADVIANKLFYCVERNPGALQNLKDVFITWLP